mgnify:CR=1 FL=1
MTILSQSSNQALYEGWQAATTAYTTAFEGLYVNRQPGAYEVYASKITNQGTQTLSKNFGSNFPQMREMRARSVGVRSSTSHRP